MIDRTMLEGLSQSSIKDAAPDTLRDILKIQIHGETARQRLENYMEQVGNPYCFRVGDTPVQVVFEPCGETLDEKIKAYFSSLDG